MCLNLKDIFKFCFLSILSFRDSCRAERCVCVSVWVCVLWQRGSWTCLVTELEFTAVYSLEQIWPQLSVIGGKKEKTEGLWWNRSAQCPQCTHSAVYIRVFSVEQVQFFPVHTWVFALSWHKKTFDKVSLDHLSLDMVEQAGSTLSCKCIFPSGYGTSRGQ